MEPPEDAEIDECVLPDAKLIGYIYLFTFILNPIQVYVGQTYQDPATRRQGHKTCCYHYRDHPEQYNINGGKRSACYKFYNAIIKYGFDKFTFKVIDVVSSDKLDERETERIIEYDSIAQGFNIMTGGRGSKKFTPEIRKKMSEKIKAAMPTTVEKIRKQPESKGAPIYVSYDKEIEGYRVRHPTLCNNQNFRIEEYGSLENAKEAASKFLIALIERGIPHVSPKVANKLKDVDGSPLPTGIGIDTSSKDGFWVRKQYKKVKYDRRFNKGDRAENLAEARAYLIEINDYISKIKIMEIELPDM